MTSPFNEDLLPDFNDMDTVSKAITASKLRADSVKLNLETKIAECVRLAYTSRDYWVNGKPPTQSYIDSVVKVLGNTPEDALMISALRLEYSNAVRDAEINGNLLETMRNRVQIFQTMSANKRHGLL